ncbi:MAG: response regulator [Patescibacteria group bacterium]|nr:response regulator [Patescibacteria group bacterium]
MAKPVLRPTGAKTIVVMDDEQLVLRSMTRRLTLAGYHVKAFSDPVRLIQALCELNMEFDLLLTDMDFDDGSGWSGARIIEELRREGFDQPMILWSGGKNIDRVTIGPNSSTLKMGKGDIADLLTRIYDLLDISA